MSKLGATYNADRADLRIGIVLKAVAVALRKARGVL